MSNRVAHEGAVLSVLGPVRPDQLGMTLTHEHIFADLTGYYQPPDDVALAAEMAGPVTVEMRGYLAYFDYWNRDNLLLADYHTAAAELTRFRRLGGGTVCELSSRGIRLDHMVAELPRLARELGVTIVAGTGCYIAAHHEPNVATASVADLTNLFIREIEHGIGETGVRTGILGEIGLSTPPEPAEWRVLEAAGLAHCRTGAPIVIHQSDFRHFEVPQQALDRLELIGVRPDRVVIAHCGFSDDLAPLTVVARRGAYLAFDHFGMPGYELPHDWQLPRERDYIRQVLALIEAGHLHRLLLSSDICAKTHLRRYGGTGYGHLLTTVRTMFLRAGLAPADFCTMLVANPAELLPLHH